MSQMGIKSIKIKNLLSFDELIINNLNDVNCIIGKNNTGKSNLLKLIKFFYSKLDNKRELPPTLNSNYSSFGTISIVYDTSRIYKIVTSNTNKGKSTFFKHIYNTLFMDGQKDTFELVLKINYDNSTKWSITNNEILSTINYLYPFFEIETRHIDLYDWDKLWLIVSRLKSFNINNIKDDDIINFFDEKISQDSNSYKEYIETIQNITKTGQYNYREKVLNFVKAGLKGHTFLIDEKSLETQSDGTNSHKFIEIALELLISLSRRDYISPTVYIDEPEIGLHPKRNEELIYKLHDVYKSYEKTKEEREKRKYKTPYPKIIFSTHSPNIVKEIIKLFETKQQILHFSKNNKNNTIVQKMNSTYDDERFLNIFSDNEARLFFSNFILFVEGATEQEVFLNKKLINSFTNIKGEKFLQNIDVYPSNNVILKYINPSYSNTSIPYLVLYDADKIINIDIQKNKLSFHSTNLNLPHYISLYRNTYIGSKKYLIYNFLKQLIEKEKSLVLDIDNNKLYIQNHDYSLMINNINKNFGKKENYFFNKTTIEEVLINANSFCLFKKWLFDEFKKSVKKSYNKNTPECIIKKIHKKKIKEIKEFKKWIDTNFQSNKEKITAFILLFGGKTETSVKINNENYPLLNEDFRNKIKKIKKAYFENKSSLNLGYLLSKTSGWTTSFLDFSINKIEKNILETDIKKRKEEFRKKFKNNFEEFYDIITTIEKKI